jgi:hypothetical protein
MRGIIGEDPNPSENITSYLSIKYFILKLIQKISHAH